jgi:hypothetical protein
MIDHHQSDRIMNKKNIKNEINIMIWISNILITKSSMDFSKIVMEEDVQLNLIVLR